MFPLLPWSVGEDVSDLSDCRPGIRAIGDTGDMGGMVTPLVTPGPELLSSRRLAAAQASANVLMTLLMSIERLGRRVSGFWLICKVVLWRMRHLPPDKNIRSGFISGICWYLTIICILIFYTDISNPSFRLNNRHFEYEKYLDIKVYGVYLLKTNFGSNLSWDMKYIVSPHLCN